MENLNAIQILVLGQAILNDIQSGTSWPGNRELTQKIF
jgi:hypothetical protein